MAQRAKSDKLTLKKETLQPLQQPREDHAGTALCGMQTNVSCVTRPPTPPTPPKPPKPPKPRWPRRRG